MLPLVVFCFFKIVILVAVKCYVMVLILISLNISDAEHIFLYFWKRTLPFSVAAGMRAHERPSEHPWAVELEGTSARP